MDRLNAYARLFRLSFAANLAAAMEYRVNFLVQVFGMILNNCAFIVFWKVLFRRAGNLGGYGFRDVMFLWAITAVAFGISHVVFGNVRNLSVLIKQGDLDVYLLQPKDVLFNAMTSRTIVSAWGDMCFGLVLFGFLRPEASAWMGFLFFSATGTLVLSATFVLGESLTLFVDGSEGLSQSVAEMILSFSLYPEKVFPEGMRWIFYSILPSGFIVFLPLAFWRAPSVGIAAWVTLAAAGYGFGAWLLFSAGLRRYESGNRISARS